MEIEIKIQGLARYDNLYTIYKIYNSKNNSFDNKLIL